MILIVIIFLVITIIILFFILKIDQKKLPKLSINENGDFVNSSGSEVILRGANIAHKMSPYTYGYDFLTPIKSHLNYIENTLGFNSTRLTVAWAQVEPTPGKYDNNYLDNIFDTVNLLQKFGIYTLFDFHSDAYAQDAGGWGWPNWAILNPDTPVSTLGFPLILFGGAYLDDTDTNLIPTTLSTTWDLFWANTDYQGRGIQDRFFDMVMYVLKRIKKNSQIKDAIQGIDIMNEPWPGTRWLDEDVFASPLDHPPVPDIGGDYYEWSDQGTSIVDNEILNPYYKNFIKRYTDENLTGDDFVLYLQPFMLFGSGCPSSLNFSEILEDTSNLQVVFNFHNYTQKASVCFDNTDTVIGRFTQNTNNNKLGIYMSEFGANPDPADWGTSIIQLSDEKKYSYNYWAYLQKLDFTFTEGIFPYTEQSIYTNPDIPFNLENINTNIVNALSNPFPKEIPGALGNFGINDTTNNFDLTFTLKNKSNKLIIGVPYNYHSGSGYTMEIYSNTQLVRTVRNNRKINISFVFSSNVFSVEDTIKVILI